MAVAARAATEEQADATARVIEDPPQNAPDADPAAPVPPVAPPSLVRCCGDDGKCFEVSSVDACYAAIDAQTPRAEQTPLSDEPFGCGARVAPVELRRDAFRILVKGCGALQGRKEHRPFRDCFISEVDLDGVAASEAVSVHWPLFSQRPERGHPNYGDPVEGAVFWVELDDRTPDLTLEAAQLTDATVKP